MNAGEAERCITISRKHFDAKNVSSALKFAQKSISLQSTPAGIAWLQLVTDAINSASAGTSTTGSNTASTSTTSTTRMRKDNIKEDTAQSKREYTEEQLAAVKRVKSVKDDFYAVLGLSKQEFTEDALKKSYRKQALQFHPDKNAAPGASDAFKIIGHAFSTLNDSQKRMLYDQHGADGPTNMASNGFSGSRSRQDFFQDEMTPEMLFNLFFNANGMADGSGMFQQQQRRHNPFMHAQTARRNRQQQQNRQRPAEPASTFRMFYQLLPLIIFFIVSWWANNASPQRPSFGWQPTPGYTYPHKTYRRHIPYYTNQHEFDIYFRGNTYNIRNFEDDIESAMVRNLQIQCSQENDEKQRKISSARWWGSADSLKQAQNAPLASCDRLRELIN